ncbi:MAG: sensor domain-containing protein [Haloferacaceae archaeon]
MALPVREHGTRLFRRTVAAPVRPQTYLNVLYLGLAFPLGIAYLTFVSIGVSLGVGLAIVVVGIPILAAVLAVVLGLADLERRLASVLLGVRIRPRTELEGDTTRRRLASLATSLETWKAVVYLPSKFLFGLAALLVVTTLLTTGVSMALVPLFYDQPGLYVGIVADRPVEIHPALYFGWNHLLVGFETAITVGSWEITTLREAGVVSVAGMAICVSTLQLLNALAWLSGRYTRIMLDGTYDVWAAAGRVLSDR